MEHQILIEMRKLFYILPFGLFLFVSCEQDANVDIPLTPPKLSVSCYITPQDSIIRAKVTLSNPVFGTTSMNPNGEVTDATVTLFGNSTSTQLVYNSTTEYYEVLASVFPIIGGNDYRLAVTDPSGRRAEGSTSVPLTPPAGFQCSVTDSVYQYDPFYEQGESKFTYSFADPGGINNYYRLVIYNVHVDGFSGDTTLQRSGWDIFSDDNADGTTISKSTTMYYYNYMASGDSLIAYDVWLISGNYDYHRFHTSIYNYSGGEDPFSEPSMIYSNIEGGLGIFAGANGTKLRIPR